MSTQARATQAPSERQQNPRGEGARLREQIIAAARDLLLVPQQPQAPSLRAVARACGVSATATYRHFASQRALMASVVEDVQLRLAAHLTAADDPAAPIQQRLESRALAYVEWGLANPGAYELIFESEDRLGLSHQDEGPGWALIEQTAELITEATRLHQESARRWATRVWVNLHGLVSLRLHKPDDDYTTEPSADTLEIVALHLSAIARA